MNNCKPKKKSFLKIAAIVAASVLSFVLLAGGAVALVSNFSSRNPSNLIDVDKNYVKSTRLNNGLELDVDKNGVIRLKGDTSANVTIDVSKGVALKKGTYTVSGIKAPDLAKCYLCVKNASGDIIAYAGLESETFTLEEDAVVSVQLYVAKSDGVNPIKVQNRVIRPCIVEGNAAGDFYK